MLIKLFIVSLLLISSASSFAQYSYNNDPLKDHSKAEKAMSEGNFAISYCLWEPLAEQGNSKAQFNIGWMYHNGYGLAIDDNKALKWWLKAAEQGYVDAFYTLADLYLAGFGVEKDKDTAMGWYIAAAELGHEASLEIILALPQHKDKLSKKYYQQLLETNWYLRAAQQGNATALSFIQSIGKNNDKKSQQYFKTLLQNDWSIFNNKMQIKVNKANVRRGTSTEYKVIATLSKGHVLIPIGQRNGWTKIGITGTGKIAWVFSTLIEPVPVPVNTPFQISPN